jgi:hypothetical protein
LNFCDGRSLTKESGDIRAGEMPELARHMRLIGKAKLGRQIRKLHRRPVKLRLEGLKA